MLDKIVIVTQKTRLDELLERHSTRAQAKFYIEHMGLDFADYDREHDAYRAAVEQVRTGLEGLLPKLQLVERSLLPTFTFTPKDLVVAVGRDGLVVNAAKYLDGQPIVGVNPDPSRWDGVLLPHQPSTVAAAARAVIEGTATTRGITMAEARLNDGQRLLAFNDLLIGQRTHVSARYELSWHGRNEAQSSSGVLVSTGAGSTGWLSSTQHMAAAVGRLLAGRDLELPRLRLSWDAPRLVFVVREPFASRSSGVRLAAGMLEAGEELVIESRMPEGGVIFSDGMEADALSFGSGMVATIGVSERRSTLVTLG